MDDELESVKITLIGNSGVGKTCIIARYIDNTFNENCDSTIGANYSQKIIRKNNKDIQVDIWDTAGQEKYHALGKHFYKDSYIVCLVYDITVKSSFESLKDIWYPDLKKYGEKYTVLAIVGNKCDKYEFEEVEEATARAFAKEIGATFSLTSAKTGDGIEKLFDTVVNIYLSPEFYPKASEMIKNRGQSFAVNKDDDNADGKKKKKKCC